MKIVFLIIVLSSTIAMAQTNSGNTININGCCQHECGANSCQAVCKPKVKVVTKVVEKRVEVPVEKVVETRVEVPYPVYHTVIETVVKRVYKKNHLSLLGGVGPTRIDRSGSDRVDLLRGPVGGLMYQRNLNERFELGIQGQTNQTGLGVLTYDF
jgi:hypothetical protein